MMSLSALLLFCLSSLVWGQAPSFLPFTQGETIRYAIKKFGVKAGSAVLNFRGVTEKEGRKTLLIVFRAEAINFFDEEKIYIDPQTFLPVCVERDLNIWGKKEQITEYYDHSKGLVKVVKQAGGKVSEQTLKREDGIENIYGFIYRYRVKGNFEIGSSLTMNLPTQTVSFLLKRQESLFAGGQEHNSFLLESRPGKYRVWFKDSTSKIPLRIDGALGLSSMSMIMENYEAAKAQPLEKS